MKSQGVKGFCSATIVNQDRFLGLGGVDGEVQIYLER